MTDEPKDAGAKGEAEKETDPDTPADDEELYGRFKRSMDRYFSELEPEAAKPDAKAKADVKLDVKPDDKKPSAAEQRTARASGGNFMEMLFGSSKPRKQGGGT